MEKMKTIVLMLSQKFPVTHSRSGEPTRFRYGFGVSKLHTIRKNKKGYWDKCAQEINEGKAILSVREWTGRPYRSKMRILAEYKKIGLQHITMSRSSEFPMPTAHVDGKFVSIYELALNDGLDLPDFIEWFFPNNECDSIFQGVILQLTDFRY